MQRKNTKKPTMAPELQPPRQSKTFFLTSLPSFFLDISRHSPFTNKKKTQTHILILLSTLKPSSLLPLQPSANLSLFRHPSANPISCFLYGFYRAKGWSPLPVVAWTFAGASSW